MRFLKSKNTAILVEIMDTEGIIKMLNATFTDIYGYCFFFFLIADVALLPFACME
jgi:hypothetical protein